MRIHLVIVCLINFDRRFCYQMFALLRISVPKKNGIDEYVEWKAVPEAAETPVVAHWKWNRRILCRSLAY